MNNNGNSLSNLDFNENTNVNSDAFISKISPKNQIKYFWIVSFVAFIIKDFVSAVPSFLYSLLVMFTSYSSLTGKDIEFSQLEPFIEIFDSIFSSFSIILFGILFVKYITNKYKFNGNIKRYRFVYYTWSFAVGGFILDITGFISSLVLSKVQFDATISDHMTTLVLGSVVSIISLTISLLAAYLCARLLNVAAFGDEISQIKELRFLAIGTTVSVVCSLIVYFVRIVVLDEFSISTTIFTMLSKLLTTVIIWIMATAKSQDKRQEKMMFTVLPIIAICDSIAFSIINAFLI